MVTSQPVYRSVRGLAVLFAILIPMVGIVSVQAQDEPKVQVLEGRIELGEVMHYQLPDLMAGDTLYAYMRNRSGNLNPLLALADGEVDLASLLPVFESELAALVEQSIGPVEAQEQVLAGIFLAADDNGGVDSDAAFEFLVLQDGDYVLLAASTLTNQTFGDYELTVGINAPEVLSGEARPTGHVIAILDEEASGIATAVQEITGTLTLAKPETFFTLNDIDEGDTLYVYIEATSGDLIPLVELTDYGGGALRNPMKCPAAHCIVPVNIRGAGRRFRAGSSQLLRGDTADRGGVPSTGGHQRATAADWGRASRWQAGATRADPRSSCGADPADHRRRSNRRKLRRGGPSRVSLERPQPGF